MLGGCHTDLLTLGNAALTVAGTIGGTAITGDSNQDTTLVNYIGTLATQAVRNEIISNSGGNNLSQSRDTSITADTNSPTGGFSLFRNFMRLIARPLRALLNFLIRS